jgi:hypothetical protein
MTTPSYPFPFGQKEFRSTAASRTSAFRKHSPERGALRWLGSSKPGWVSEGGLKTCQAHGPGWIGPIGRMGPIGLGMRCALDAPQDFQPGRVAISLFSW